MYQQPRTVKVYWIVSVIVLLLVTTLISFHQAAAATPLSLGTAASYNQFIFNDVTLSDSAIQGAVAYGGNVNLTNVGYGTGCPAGTLITVGGNVTYNSGSVFGAGVAGGTIANSASFFCGGSWSSGTPLDFNAAALELSALSATYQNAPSQGDSIKDEIEAQCVLELKGRNSDLNVFNIDGAMLNALRPTPQNQASKCYLLIEAPCSATVLINISGTIFDLQSLDIVLLDAGGGSILANQVLFNFFDATQIDLDDTNFEGSVLAPGAAVSGANFSYIQGTLIADSLSGILQGQHYPFGAAATCAMPDYDYGDLPESYPVKLLANGARHEIDGLTLGATIDNETDGQPSSGADGDGPDEDGVTANPDGWSAGTDGGNVIVEASGVGCLYGWIDWNENGDFAASERIIDKQLLNSGSQAVMFNVPANVPAGMKYARFRIVPLPPSQVCPSVGAGGLVAGGEVEDYRFNLMDPTGVTLAASGATAPAPVLYVTLIVLLALLTTAGVAVRRR